MSFACGTAECEVLELSKINTLERALLKPQRIVIHLHTLHATCVIFSSVNLNAPGVISVNWCNKGRIILPSY
jgi:hypothetical protein